MCFISSTEKIQNKNCESRKGLSDVKKNFGRRDDRGPKGRKEITKNRPPCHFRTNGFFCRQTFRQSFSSSLFCCSVAHDSSGGSERKSCRGKIMGRRVCWSNHPCIYIHHTCDENIYRCERYSFSSFMKKKVHLKLWYDMCTFTEWI